MALDIKHGELVLPGYRKWFPLRDVPPTIDSPAVYGSHLALGVFPSKPLHSITLFYQSDNEL